jgi:hypothetical protein
MAAAAAAGPGKSECDALFLQLTKRVERHLAINLWGAKLGVVDRHAQLKRALEDIDKIHTAIPRERAEELIADLAAKHGITKTTVGDPAFALALSAAATGDAATIDAAKGATAAGDVDEPPF